MCVHWDNRGMLVSGIIHCFLVEFEAHSAGRKSYQYYKLGPKSIAKDVTGP